MYGNSSGILYGLVVSESLYGEKCNCFCGSALCWSIDDSIDGGGYCWYPTSLGNMLP